MCPVLFYFCCCRRARHTEIDAIGVLLHILFLIVWWELCTILLSCAFRLSDGAHYAESDAYHGEDHSSQQLLHQQTNTHTRHVKNMMTKTTTGQHCMPIPNNQSFSMQCVLKLTKLPREQQQCCVIMFGKWWHYNNISLHLLPASQWAGWTGRRGSWSQAQPETDLYEGRRRRDEHWTITAELEHYLWNYVMWF